MANRLFPIALVALIVQFWPLSCQAEPYLVANIPAADGVTISRQEVRGMYLNQKPKWPSGQLVRLAIMAKGKIRDNFLREFIGKNNARFERYWKRQLFTGRGVPPHNCLSKEELLSYVRKTPGAIGFIESPHPPSGVAILKISGNGQGGHKALSEEQKKM